MKCGRAVENTGIFSQDAASSAGEAQAQPMLFFKYTRSIGWLPKLWWRSTGNMKMPMVNGPGHESIWIRQIADTCAFEYLNIGSYIHYEVIMCLAKPISYREFVWWSITWKGMECDDKDMERHGMWWTFANCNGDYGEKVRLEIETQQLTLNQDKQREHNLNLTLWQRKTPFPRRSTRLMN